MTASIEDGLLLQVTTGRRAAGRNIFRPYRPAVGVAPWLFLSFRRAKSCNQPMNNLQSVAASLTIGHHENC